MIQFITYLNGELGKLKKEDDAAGFITALGTDFLKELQLSIEPAELSRQFSTQEEVSYFVEELSKKNVIKIVELGDRRWRKNGVFKRLNEYLNWTVHSIAINEVDIQQAEPNLGSLFQDHNNNLVAIATDPTLLEQQPYSNANVGDPVAYQVLLAARWNGRYRVFDGIHRAIQLVRNKEQVLHLCTPF